MCLSIIRASVVSLLLAAVPPVYAQTVKQAKPFPFSDKAQEVLARLDSFQSLDAKQWRYHAGNIPDGQDPGLDDSSWQVITRRGGLPAEAVWFRREIVVPQSLSGYSLANARIEFSFRVDSRGAAPLIIFLDGRRVALGADLAPIVLWEKAQPGDHVLIAVKALATDAEKSFQGARISVTTDPSRPSPGDFYKEAVSDSWVMPAVPGGAAKEYLLEQAVDAVDVNALDQGDQMRFDASLRKAQQILEPLEPLLKQATVDMVGNSHMDVA